MCPGLEIANRETAGLHANEGAPGKAALLLLCTCEVGSRHHCSTVGVRVNARSLAVASPAQHLRRTPPPEESAVRDAATSFSAAPAAPPPARAVRAVASADPSTSLGMTATPLPGLMRALRGLSIGALAL